MLADGDAVKREYKFLWGFECKCHRKAGQNKTLEDLLPLL